MEILQRAAAAGRMYEDIPLNHSAKFAPVVEPTRSTGIGSTLSAAAGWLSHLSADEVVPVA